MILKTFLRDIQSEVDKWIKVGPDKFRPIFCTFLIQCLIVRSGRWVRHLASIWMSYTNLCLRTWKQITVLRPTWRWEVVIKTVRRKTGCTNWILIRMSEDSGWRLCLMNLGFRKSATALTGCPNIRPSTEALLHGVHIFLIRVILHVCYTHCQSHTFRIVQELWYAST
jgi:hypothetical protein